MRNFSKHQNKYLSIIFLVFCASIFPGCNSPSTPVSHQSSINLIEQTSINAIVKSRKYPVSNIQHIGTNQLNSSVIKDNSGQQYWITSKKIEPMSHGTIEIKLRFTESKGLKTGQRENLTKKMPNKNNFAGIAFSMRNDKKPYMVLIDQTGELSIGKLGGEPLSNRQVDISESISESTSLKISFMNDHLIIFIDGIPYTRLKKLKVKNIEIISIVAKYFPKSEKKLHFAFERSGIKYRHLKPLSKKDSKNIFRYLEEENAMESVHFDQDEDNMHIFSLPKNVSSEKNNSQIMLGYSTINSETRPFLYAPAPTKIEYPITIPPQSSLYFAYAIAPTGWGNSDGVNFSVSFKANKAEKKKLFSHFLDPQKPKNRKWFEQRVDLSSIAGLSGKIILETLPYDETQSGSKKKDELFDFGLWGDPVISPERKVDNYNLILISLDTLRADHLGANGYFRNTSPNMDSLTKNGVFFKNTVSQSPWTLPSHMSMFTSLYPSELGYSLMNRINKKVRIPDQATTLAEVLKKNGYLTAGFSGGANISSVFGFDKGFNFYNERWRTEIDVVFKNLSDWIQKHRKDKFFLFFHTYEIHEYPPGEHEIFTEGINPRDKVNMHNALYDGKIKYVDDYIGRLIERLKSLNLLDKTLIVITSDHGEEFFEHGLGGHGDHLYDEVLLVPLIFHLKGTVPENVMIKNQVRVIDIMPTVLDILDVPVPKIIEGVSLVPFFKKSATTPLVAFTEAADNLNRLNIVEPVSIRTPEYKYIFYPRLKEEVLTYLKSKKKITGYSVDMYNQGEGELYNLIDDPEELNNIIKLNNSVAKDLRNEVVSFININQEKDFTKGKPQETVKIDRATRERLEALGYLQ